MILVYACSYEYFSEFGNFRVAGWVLVFELFIEKAGQQLLQGNFAAFFFFNFIAAVIYKEIANAFVNC